VRRLRAALLRLRGVFDTARRERERREFDDELASHLAMHIDDNLRNGMTPEAARHDAILKLGGVAQTREQYRDRRTVPFLEHLIQDLRYALRTLRKDPGFATTAILTLALGIGANTAMFSFADATAFRPPDVPRPGELVRLFTTTKTVPYDTLSSPDYRDYRDRTQSFSGLVAYSTRLIAMSRGRDEVPQLFGGWAVSGNFFSVLGVEPTLGRGFRDDDDRVPGANAVVVLSHNLWERRFQSDPAVIGTRVTLGGRDFTIIGVAPAAFSGTELYFHPDLYVPLSMTRDVSSGMSPRFFDDRSQRWLTTVGRLKAGASVGAATTEVAALARSFEQTYPDSNRGRAAMVLPELSARARLDSGGVQGAGFLLGIVGLVLLIGCVNVANLTLSRAAGRSREIAVRLALGASRGRLIRQLLAESLLLAFLGGSLGLLFAYWGVAYLSTIKIPTDLPIAFDARLDQRVLLFTLATSMATGIVFGLAPAFRSTRVDLIGALKASAKTFVGGRRRRLAARNALVGTQLAASVVLLVTAGVAIRSFVKAQHADPGFRTDHVLLVSFDPTLIHYDESQTKRFYRRIVEKTQTLAGVASVGLAQFIPLGISSGSQFLVVDGYQMPEGQDRLSISANTVDSGFWPAMRAPIARGRVFDERDTDSSPKVIIVNETMARQYWPNQDALGKVVRLRDRNGPAAQVIGIARDGKYGTLLEPPQPFVFLPLSQRYRAGMTLVVLAKSNPVALAAPVRAAVEAVDANVPMFDVRTLDDLYQARAMLPPRLTSQLVTSLGLLGAVLAVIGLYGVVAYVTAGRTHEIGIRMAVGADRWNVLLLVLKQAAGVVIVGLIAGVGLALFFTPALAEPFDINPRDGTVFILVPLALAGVALLASLIPARRAANIDPMVALREE
jgi:predicted permease